MSSHEQQEQQEQQEQHEQQHDDDPMLILLAFVAAAGFGSGVPLLGLFGLLACAGHIAAKVDPTGAPARLLAVAAQQPGRLLSAAQQPAPVAEGDQADTHPATADVFDLLTSGRHVLLVGSTGGGKSTLLHHLAALHAKQRASVLVIDVDAIAGTYPGYRVVGCGDDYDAAKAGLIIVRRELAKRREARRNGQRTFSRMVLLIDETQDVVRELDTAWPIIEDVVRRGRKLNIFAVIAAQDSQVGTLRLEGKSALLGNLTRVDVQRQGRNRVALIDGSAYHLPTLTHPDELVQAKQTSLAQTGLAKNTLDSRSEYLLADLLVTGLRQSEGQSCRSDEVEPDRSGSGFRPAQTGPDRTTIAAAYARLGSKNKVWEWLRDEYGIRAKPLGLQMIDAAIEQEQERYRVVGE
jgi:energy-coupling factor transporter ATP-binding protein EcfA2